MVFQPLEHLACARSLTYIFLKTIKIFKTYKVAQKIVFWALEKILSTDFSSDQGVNAAEIDTYIVLNITILSHFL